MFAFQESRVTKLWEVFFKAFGWKQQDVNLKKKGNKIWSLKLIDLPIAALEDNQNIQSHEVQREFWATNVWSQNQDL